MSVYCPLRLVHSLPVPFTYSGTDGFGYNSSLPISTITDGTLIYSSSRLDKLTTSSEVRIPLCNAATGTITPVRITAFISVNL
jgi:hypothetical protein